MPTAMCVTCQHCIKWRNRRGSWLADMCCPKCGGRLQAVRKHGRGFTPLKHSGKYVRCAICGTRRQENGLNIKRVEVLSRLAEEERQWRLCHNLPVLAHELPAGTPICWHHRLVPAAKQEAGNGG